MSQMVHVVSILDVMMSFGDNWFQSSEVRGAVCSGVFEFESNARGASFCVGGGLLFALDDRGIVLLMTGSLSDGRDHSRR